MVAKTRKAISDAAALPGLKYQRLHPSNKKMDATSVTPAPSGLSFQRYNLPQKGKVQPLGLRHSWVTIPL